MHNELICMFLKKISLSLCIFGLMSSAWAQFERVAQRDGIEEYRLKNGLQVLIVPNDQETKVMLDVVYFTGSLNDPEGKSGLAHLLEHLAFKGTKHIAGNEFQRRLDKYTLRANAVTNHYATRYLNVIRPDAESIRQVLQLEAERMHHLVLKADDVSSEIEIVKREREVRMDKAPALMADELLTRLYGDQSLGRMPIGRLDELKSIQLAELQKYYQTWYAPNNAALVITGKFNKDEVLQQLDTAFSSIPAKSLPPQPATPRLDVKQIQSRQINIQKGRDYSTQLIYVAAADSKLRQALSYVPYLYSAQPMGQLYKNIVLQNKATTAGASPWLTPDFNIVYMSAGYSRKSEASQVTNDLIQESEVPAQFNESQLQRAKLQMKNSHDKMLADSSATSAMLGGVLAQEKGNWRAYFDFYDALQKIEAKQINQQLQRFFQPQHRLIAYIEPTLQSEPTHTASPMNTAQAETVHILPSPRWSQKQFQQSHSELKQLESKSQARLTILNQQIQRGALKNGLKYAFFPTRTPDQQTYATLTINFGDSASLANQAAALDLMNSLLLKGSSQYTYEQIVDKSIELNGKAKSSMDGNQLKIEIQAPEQTFASYLMFILNLIKDAKFTTTEFDVQKKQRLSALQRTFTEPKLVTQIQLGRVLEQYPAEDLRFHFEPKQLYTHYQKLTPKKISRIHQQLIGMNQAQLTVTGQIDQQVLLNQIKQQLSDWTTTASFERIGPMYHATEAQNLHMQSEPREFGAYQGYLNFPVGAEHPDAAALIVIAQVLGNSQLSSRLALELREKTALVYGFSSRLDLDPFRSVGSLRISAEYSTEKTTQISAAVRKTLMNLINQGLTPEELERAKIEVMKQRIAAVEDTSRVHRLLNSQLERNLDMQSRIQRDHEITSLTLEQANAVIKRYINLDQFVEVRADAYGTTAFVQ